MPVVFLKYKLGLLPNEVMHRIADELPKIISSALDVPDDPDRRMTPGDIQVWSMPRDIFDRNIKHNLQMIIPVHGYIERLVNLEERKDLIVSAVRKMAGDYSNIGWVWILPSSNTAFGVI